MIIGAKRRDQLTDKRRDQLTDNLRAREVQLTADELHKLDEVSALPAEYPGWMIARQGSDRIPGAVSPVAQKK